MKKIIFLLFILSASSFVFGQVGDKPKYGKYNFKDTAFTIDEPYDATLWNGNFSIPTKNALRDKIEALSLGGGGVNIFNTDGILTGNRSLSGSNNTYGLNLDSLNSFIVWRNAIARLGMNSVQSGLFSPNGLNSNYVSDAVAALTFNNNANYLWVINDSSIFHKRASYEGNLHSTFNQFSLVDKKYVDSIILTGGSGETNTGSNLGGGLDNYTTKSGVDLRFNTFAAADFDLASNLITIDATKWLTISAAAAAYQPLDGDLTYLAGFTPSANVKTILNAADYAAVKTALSLTIGTNVQAWDSDLDTWAGKTPYAGALTITTAKTVNITNSLTLSGTDATTMTFPTTTATIARTDAAQTFTGTQTFSSIVVSNNAITAVGNAATVPITSNINTVTNNSAATLTITMTTASAVDGQLSTVRILDFSGVAQTISWVNTENSGIAAPTTSNGSTTLPLTVKWRYNSATSKWRVESYN